MPCPTAPTSSEVDAIQKQYFDFYEAVRSNKELAYQYRKLEEIQTKRAEEHGLEQMCHTYGQVINRLMGYSAVQIPSKRPRQDSIESEGTVSESKLSRMRITRDDRHGRVRRRRDSLNDNIPAFSGQLRASKFGRIGYHRSNGDQGITDAVVVYAWDHEKALESGMQAADYMNARASRRDPDRCVLQ